MSIWAESLLAETAATLTPFESDILRSGFAERAQASEREANLWLRQHLSGPAAVELMITRGLSATEAAEYLAKRFTFCEGFDDLCRMARRQGVPVPRGRTEAGAIARARSPHYWRRWLRVELYRWREQRRRAAGLVRKGVAMYLSDESLEAIRRRDAESARVLAEEMTAISDHGDEKSVAELAGDSITGPAKRGIELMVRARGFEEYAEREGHPWTFATMTLPGEWHAFYEDSGRPVKHYNGERPDAGCRHLQTLWARCRAQLDREGVRFYGFRVVEPNHDGTPHWHALVFCESDDKLAAFKQAVRDHFAPGLPDDHPRVKFEDHDPDKGGAADYLGKYVAKNISGAGLDEAEHPKVERARAWVRLWGVRQFAQLGGPPVGIYRELRKIGPGEANSPLLRGEGVKLPESMRAAWEAANAADWCAFMDCMGGPFVRRSELPIEPLRGIKVGLNGWRSPSETSYGEPLRTLDYDIRPIVGLKCGDDELLTYRKVWQIEFRRPPLPAGAAPAFCDGGAGGAWTRVSNCTADPRPPP